MRIKEIKLYEFNELSEDAKDKAIEKLYNINVDYEWWDSIYDDAETIGLKIESFDIDRGAYCKGLFTQSAEDVAKAILENHGKSCETYKTAKAYLKELKGVKKATNKDDDPDTEEIDAEFLKSLCEDYRIMLSHEYDYLTSREAIIEMIEANEYEFDENGKLS